MRKKILLVLAVLLNLCILSGCRKKTEVPALYEPKQFAKESQVTLPPTAFPTKEPQPKKAIILSKNIRKQLMSRDNSRVLLNADYSYPQIENVSGLESIDLINQEIKEAAETQFKINYEDVEKFALEFDLIPMDPGRPSSLLPLVSEQTYEVKYNDNYLISVFVTTFQHFGGAHPSTTYSSYTYNVLTGEKLSAAYFLPDEKSKEEVKQYVAEVFLTVYNQDKERFYPDTNEILSEGKFDYGYYITEDEIVFYINPYEIAPYAAGLQEASVQR